MSNKAFLQLNYETQFHSCRVTQEWKAEVRGVDRKLGASPEVRLLAGEGS